MMGLTQELAHFVVGTKFDDIPRDGIERAKRLILDCIGVSLAAANEPAVEIASAFVQELGGNCQASVIGRGFRTSVLNAALLNGVSAHALDFDDASQTMIGHPTAAILPAVLAVAEHREASGEEVLVAYVVGVELATKLGVSVNPGHYARGWHATATLGTLGAVAAAAKLMRLDVDQIRHAFGVAASQASGLRQNFGTMTKPLQAGQASRNGVFAAALAARGFTADPSILENRFGFLNTLCNGFSEANQDEFIARLGTPFELVTPGVSIKRYPSCHGTSYSIDALLELVEEGQIEPDDVASIRCRIPRLISQMLIYANPQSGLEGKFSLQFCLAAALVDRNVSLRHFTEPKIHDPRIRRVMDRIDVDISDEPGDYGEVSITLHDGRMLERRVTEPKGSPGNPLTDNQVASKFIDCAGLAVSHELAYKIMAKIMELEKLDNLTELMAWIAKGPIKPGS